MVAGICWWWGSDGGQDLTAAGIKNYVARKVQQIVTYRCPLAYACQCKSMLRVVRTAVHVLVEIKEEHNSKSHAKDTYKNLKATHKSALLKIVHADPSLSSTAVRRQIHQAEDASVEIHRSVQQLVRKECIPS